MKRHLIVLLLLCLPCLSQVRIPGPGGSSAACPSVTGHDYTTAFPGTEAILSECSNWIEGGATGLDWNNFKKTPAFAQGIEAATHANLDDPTAILAGTWGNDQEAWGTIVAPTGGTSNTDKEIELRLRSTMTAHSSTGYELQLTPFQTTTSGCGSTLIRWNGAVNNFTAITGGTLIGGGAGQCLHTGDVIRATIIGTAIEYFINGMLRYSNTESTYTSGAPGIGSFILSGGGLTIDYGFSAFTATDTVFHSQQSKAANVATTQNPPVVAPAMTSNTTTGNMIWCIGYWADTARTATVSDAANGTYTANANGPQNGAGALSAYRAETFWKLNITGATTPTISMTLSGASGSPDRALACIEVKGPTTVDKSTALKIGSGTAMTSNTTPTTTAVHEYLAGGCVSGGSYSSPLAAPFTERQSASFGGNVAADQIVTATGAYQLAATQTSSNFICGLDTFK